MNHKQKDIGYRMVLSAEEFEKLVASLRKKYRTNN